MKIREALTKFRNRAGSTWAAAGSLFDLKLLAPFRDLLLAGGFACMVRGVALVNLPAAWIVAGAGMMAASYLMAKK